MIRSFHSRRVHRARTLRLALLLMALGATGCAQMGTLKSKVSDTFSGSGSSSAAPTGSAADAAAPMPLNAIVGTYLMKGRYAEGEQHLRQYLAKYPNDRAAQLTLRQLTTDPKVALGAKSRAYVAQAGDTYSTLAARHLGDSSLFLVLARYNGSTNPSSLHAGDAVRLPLAGVRPNLSPDTTVRTATRGASSTTTTAASAAAPVATTPDSTPAADSRSTRAQRLQSESSTLLKQGQKDQALARLDEALTLDPQLRPAGNQALRDQLLASYHERAVVLYRDQKLDQAIALWDHVLAIDPGYERAVVYRQRAIELQQRLKQI